MTEDSLLVRARALWQELASVPVVFGAAGDVDVVVAARSRMCPPGWVGVVVLGGAGVVVAPSEEAAGRLRGIGLDAGRLADPGALAPAVGQGEALGPAALAYLARDDFRPVEHGTWPVEERPAGHLDLAVLERAAGAEDTEEAGLDGITSPAFVVRAGGRPAAAAGYRAWPARTAHLSVLTAPDQRGKGLARAAASAAVRHALAHGLLPQWRARPESSRKTANALGFTELGFQLSLPFHPLPAPHDDPAPRRRRAGPVRQAGPTT